jgi:hypothetical protein
VTAPALWQPGLDAPLFPAELLNGPAALVDLDPELRAQVREYLTAVVHDRGPMHVNVAWNALHYGWDLARRSYTETLLNVDELITLDQQRLEQTPTGTIAKLWTETPVWVEVVHVEAGDLVGDDDGHLAGPRSGAPYDENIRLRAVLDPGVFGPVDPDSQRALDRLGRRGILDYHGHLVAANAPHDLELAEEVAGDPIRAYARWLAADPARLGGGPVPLALDSTDPDLTARAVAASLHSLLALAADEPRLAVVGEHLLPTGAQSTLENEDVDDIVRTSVRVRRRELRYTAVGVALRALGADRRIQRTRYIAALTQLNAALTDRALTGGSDSAVTRLRLDDPGRGAGVWRAVGPGQDDPGDGCDPRIPLGLGYAASLNTADVLASPAAEPEVEAPAAEPAPPSAGTGEAPAGEDTAERDDPGGTPPRPEPEQGEEGERGDGLLGDLDITASHLTYTVALRTRHLTDGTLSVPSTVHDEHLTKAPPPLAVRLGHPGHDLDDDETFHEPVTAHTSPCQLRGITWPLAFYPGLLLTATWTVGGRILDVSSEQLPNPVLFAGQEIKYATDLTILAAYLGLQPPDDATQAAAAGDHAEAAQTGASLDGDAPGDVGTGDTDTPAEDNCGTGGPTSHLQHAEQDLADPANRAFLAQLLRTAGRAIEPGEDGVRSFTAPVLVATAFAGLVVPKDAVGRAHRTLDAHAARGRLLRIPGERKLVSVTAGFIEGPPTYLWWPPGGSPPVHRLPNVFGSVVRRAHQVPITIRELPPGWTASPEKIAAWPQVWASLGPTHLPRVLRPGTTWVEAHERGRDPGWRSGAVRG